MEEAADSIVRYLYENLFSKETGQRACALIRLFKTHVFGQLDEDLREFARTRLAGAVRDTCHEVPGAVCQPLVTNQSGIPERVLRDTRQSLCPTKRRLKTLR